MQYYKSSSLQKHVATAKTTSGNIFWTALTPEPLELVGKAKALTEPSSPFRRIENQVV